MEGAAQVLPASSPLLALDQQWAEVALGFLVEKGRRSGSRHTLHAYGRTLTRFLCQVRDPALVRPMDVHRFAYGVGPRAVVPSASTVAVRLAAVGGFYDFAVRMELLDRNPAANVRRPIIAQRPARGLNVAEVRRLLGAIPDTESGRVDRAITITAILTGLRRTELIELCVMDPLPGDRPRFVVRTKGGVVRMRELPQPAYEAICDSRQTGAPNPGSERRAFGISDATYYSHLRRYGESAGLGWLTPHVLRHTAAKLRRQSGATIEAVSALLGHKSIATTAIYLRRIESDQDSGWQAVSASLGVGFTRSDQPLTTCRMASARCKRTWHQCSGRAAARTAALPIR